MFYPRCIQPPDIRVRALSTAFFPCNDSFTGRQWIGFLRKKCEYRRYAAALEINFYLYILEKQHLRQGHPQSRRVFALHFISPDRCCRFLQIFAVCPAIPGIAVSCLAVTSAGLNVPGYGMGNRGNFLSAEGKRAGISDVAGADGAVSSNAAFVAVTPGAFLLSLSICKAFPGISGVGAIISPLLFSRPLSWDFCNVWGFPKCTGAAGAASGTRLPAFSASGPLLSVFSPSELGEDSGFALASILAGPSG